MRYDGEHKARTRERVLREAAAAIRSDGPDRVGIAAIMARAGLTHGGFYAHFASKEDLLGEAVGYMFRDLYALCFADIDVGEPRGTLRRFVDFYLSMRHLDARDSGCPIPILAGELGRFPQPAQAQFADAVERLTVAISTLLYRAGVADPRARAISGMAEMVGAVAIARCHADRRLAEELMAVTRASIDARFDLAATPDGSTPPG